ncbi:MAG: VOC family protein [Verrucomicrobiota bacterium]
MSNQTAPSVSLSLTVKNGHEALEFYAKAMSAKEVCRMPTPDGGIAHAEFLIGNTLIFLSDESSEWHAKAMPEDTMASCLFGISCDDCDKAHQKAIEAGAKSLKEPKDEFWGMRSSMVLDPFGYRWSFGQKIEDLSDEEIAERAQKIR